MLDIILPNIPPHEHYVEPFAGTASVFFAKPLAQLNTLNDIDENIVNFFRVLQDPEKTRALLRRLRYTPYSRSEYRRACRMLHFSRSGNDVMRAWAFYVAQTMSVAHSYHYDKIGCGFGYSRQQKTVVYATYFRRLRRLAKMADKLRHAQIECIDGVELMRKFDSPNAFMFVDPPYISSTVRLKGTIYAREYDDYLHERLLEFAVSAKAKIMIASYPNELYDSLLGRGWLRIDKQKVISAVRISSEDKRLRRPRRVESAYINYKPPINTTLL